MSTPWLERKSVSDKALSETFQTPAMGDQEAVEMMKFKTLQIVTKPTSSVSYIYLNRPALHNALPLDFFTELPAAVAALDRSPATRVIVLSARGRSFCSGIDLSALRSLSTLPQPDPGRARELFRRQILRLQSAFSALERCRKPVVAEIDGACVGAGVDLAAACDVRYCTARAAFVVKEVDLAIAADLGTLQRLPRIVGWGRAAEMAITARRVMGDEAKEMGLVSQVFATRDEMEQRVAAICEGVLFSIFILLL